MSHRYDIDPEDAGCYMITCLKCRRRYHASEVHECFELDDSYTPPLERRLDEPEGVL